MSYAKLAEVIENLPPEQQAAVFDFAEFLLVRHNETNQSLISPINLSNALTDLLANPLQVDANFSVIKRDELYDRACFH